MKKRLRITCLLFSVYFFYACNPTKKFGENEYLLTKKAERYSGYKISNTELKEGVAAIIKQKPNKKILGVLSLHLALYTWGDRGKPNGFNTWLKNIGEEPVILDTTLTARSVTQISRYLDNNGYFNSQVRDSTILNRKKKRAKVYYNIYVGEPYRVLALSKNISDPAIEKIVAEDSANILIKPGEIYSSVILQKERERITSLLKDRGYFYFNQHYISYTVDSSMKSHLLKINMQIENIDETSTSKGEPHQTFVVKNIFVKTGYDPLQTQTGGEEDTVLFKDCYIIFPNHYHRFKPEGLTENIFIKRGDLFRQNVSDYTYRSLSDLGVFRFVNIRYEPVTDTINQSVYLNCYILLSPYLKQSYSIELEGTNNGGNPGIAGDFGYHNKNTFKGAELYELKLKGLLESQKNFISNQAENNTLGIFNTYEFGIENDLYLPKVLFPFKGLRKWGTYSSPKTSFEANYNFQRRPEFQRRIVDFSAGLVFRGSKYTLHYVYPAEINFVDITLQPEFVQQLIQTNDLFLFLNYTDHFITNGRYTFVYNDQQLNKAINFTYFRFNFEIAGNSLRLIDQLNGSRKDENSHYRIFGNAYAQYVKPDVDLRYYQVFSSSTSLVYRISGGVGIPYLNSSFLPYEKNFFAGGTSDLRAFTARTIGPGSYSSNVSFERIGEIKINANIEYRFEIIRILKGAFFADAGNIWLLKNDSSRPGGQFKADKFISEIAIGSGFGFRFDFTFFIFRIDFGVPLKDPSYEPNDRWYFKRLQLKDINTNFGIGFPF